MANILNSNDLIIPYIQFGNPGGQNKAIAVDSTIPLIAPSIMSYSLNTTYFNSNVLPSLGQISSIVMNLDCGNGQKLPLNLTTYQFQGTCIYFKKGTYALDLDTSYTTLSTSEKIQKSFPAGNVVFSSEITITPTKTDVIFNDAKTEMIVGKAPTKVSFDASEVFKDL